MYSAAILPRARNLILKKGFDAALSWALDMIESKTSTEDLRALAYAVYDLVTESPETTAGDTL